MRGTSTHFVFFSQTNSFVLYFVLRNSYREFSLSYTCSCQAFCRHYSLLSCPRGPEGFSVQWVTQLGFVLFVSLSLYRRMWCIMTQFALVRSRSQSFLVSQLLIVPLVFFSIFPIDSKKLEPPLFTVQYLLCTTITRVSNGCQAGRLKWRYFWSVYI